MMDFKPITTQTLTVRGRGSVGGEKGQSQGNAPQLPKGFVRGERGRGRGRVRGRGSKATLTGTAHPAVSVTPVSHEPQNIVRGSGRGRGRGRRVVEGVNGGGGNGMGLGRGTVHAAVPVTPVSHEPQNGYVSGGIGSGRGATLKRTVHAAVPVTPVSHKPPNVGRGGVNPFKNLRSRNSGFFAQKVLVIPGDPGRDITSNDRATDFRNKSNGKNN